MSTANNDLYYCDSNSGLKVEILTGKDNFARWFREIKMVADYKGVWKLIVRGVPDPTMPRPVRPMAPNPANTNHAGRLLSNQQTARSLHQVLDLVQYQANFAVYTFNTEEWNQTQEKSGIAKALLLSTVNSTLRVAISSKATAKDMMNEIWKFYEMSTHKAASITKTKITELPWPHYQPVGEFIEKVLTYQKDIINLGVQYSDEQVITKVLRTLPRSFDGFEQRWECDFRNVNAETPVITLYNRLLDWERQL